MDLGNRLLNLRKKEGLSQEEVADRLGVSRQTVSKWETNQSQPDFDKIIPLCNMYGISADELLKGEEVNLKKNDVNDDILYHPNQQHIVEKRAQYVGCGILLYFVAIALFMLMPTLHMDPMLTIAIFMIICGVGTYMIVYANMVYKISRSLAAKKKSKLLRRTISVITMIMACIYLIVSFVTFAWHITWILWIVNAIIIEIVRLVFTLKGAEDEE